MISLIDYGVGNLRAFLNLYERLNIPVTVASSPEEVLQAEKLILPGVGHFDHAMMLFNSSGLREIVTQRVIRDKVPILGICVGMQMLATSSDEGQEAGLGWIPGTVKSLTNTIQDKTLPLPHMGWNDVLPSGLSPLYKGFESSGGRFYFLHSYYYLPEDMNHSIGLSNYGFDFCCSVNKDNIFGVQFHPEKSHDYGELLLKNFAELV